jgi:exodeoxyribonuclease V beta subunit
MKGPPPFDLAETPLENGASLLEASAGTGKTYTIAGLFLRLFLEKEMSIRQILVVTFTEAATEELRDRIRHLIARCLDVFSSGASDPNFPFLNVLLERFQGRERIAQARLQQALSDFDEAPIYTIHGFCQRMLKDRAFETGSLFDTELAPDLTPILQETADDYWRRQFYEANPLGGRFALKNGFSPEKFVSILRTWIRHPSLKLLSGLEGKTLNEISATLESAFHCVRELWRDQKDEIQACFGSATKWGNKPYNNDTDMAALFGKLDRCLSASQTGFDALDCLEAFCTSALLAKISKKAKCPPPSHAFFEHCAILCQAEKDFLVALQIDFLEFARQELPRRKDLLKVQSFDDLLTRLHQALESPEGGALAGQIRRQFRAALIDEFQDTDPVQYAIFSTIFSGDEHSLFLIGDPKQAIYGFRGADIFAYLKAVEQARRFTLIHNWRSETGLVQAVNRLFAHPPNPFVFDEIGFHPVNAKGAADKNPLTLEGGRLPPLTFWLVPQNGGKPVAKGLAETHLPGVVASEIARLLNGDTKIGQIKLQPKDIAVLVMENQQAQKMQAALQQVHIPSVLHTNASLFDSREAREVECILAAIARPADERLVRSALSTDLLGVGWETLEALGLDDASWQERLQRFRDYLERWLSRGFISMFRQLIQKERLRPRLLAFPDGERRLTNVLHLAEVLQQAALDRKLGANGLLKWLAEQRNGEGEPSEEYQLRLERDEKAVQIVTVHKSKGLEYNVVFCPFGWRSSDIQRNHEDQVFFHDPEHDYTFCRDLGSPGYEEHKQLAIREKLAENVRLLYVALTRARHRCYFVWGSFNKAETSAPVWLLHRPAEMENETITTIGERFKILTDEQIRTDLEKLANNSAHGSGGPTIQVEDLPQPDGERYGPEDPPILELKARAFTGSIRTDWRIASFSWMTTGRPDELPDRDSTEEEPVQPEPASGIFAFPRGAKPGTCLHEIFESIDFTEAGRAARPAIIGSKLAAYGFPEPAHRAAVEQMVEHVLAVPLDPSGGELSLGSAGPSARLNELEFYFPIQRLAPGVLQETFAAFGEHAASSVPQRLGRLQFDPASGFMKGYIDLVFQAEEKFYIVDWKSNWLGNKVENYSQSRMQPEMSERLYVLQYHLYTLALDRYLSKRLPAYNYDLHFGGVFYMFLRGVDRSRPEFGIYRDRPGGPLVAALREKLLT